LNTQSLQFSLAHLTKGRLSIYHHLMSVVVGHLSVFAKTFFKSFPLKQEEKKSSKLVEKVNSPTYKQTKDILFFLVFCFCEDGHLGFPIGTK
jgi:hypothetical protein